MSIKNKTLVIVIHNSVKIHEMPKNWFETIVDKYRGKEYKRIIRLDDTEISYESDLYNYTRNDEYVTCEQYL